jgi:hypothetical protein
VIPHAAKIGLTVITCFFVKADKEEKMASEAKERAEETKLEKAVKTLLSLKLSETPESGTGA